MRRVCARGSLRGIGRGTVPRHFGTIPAEGTPRGKMSILHPKLNARIVPTCYIYWEHECTAVETRGSTLQRCSCCMHGRQHRVCVLIRSKRLSTPTADRQVLGLSGHHESMQSRVSIVFEDRETLGAPHHG